MPNSIFFSQKGTKNSQFAADCQSTKIECTMHKYQKTKIRGREVINKSLNKMLI